MCVIQIATPDKTFAIDSLVLHKLIAQYLKPVFENSDIVKVLHGCDNDIVWLVTNFGIWTKNIFDTGRAYLVFSKHLLNRTFKVNNLPSLTFLSKCFLQVELDKSYQKCDWRIRPLTKSKWQMIIIYSC